MSSERICTSARAATYFLAAHPVIFFMIAAVASWLPARRAARLAPTAALREE